MAIEAGAHGASGSPDRTNPPDETTTPHRPVAFGAFCAVFAFFLTLGARRGPGRWVLMVLELLMLAGAIQLFRWVFS